MLNKMRSLMLSNALGIQRGEREEEKIIVHTKKERETKRTDNKI